MGYDGRIEDMRVVERGYPKGQKTKFGRKFLCMHTKEKVQKNLSRGRQTEQKGAIYFTLSGAEL